MMTDETLFAWLDGELDAEQAARVAAEVAADPVLSKRVAEHRSMHARLKHAFDGLLDAPVPERFSEAVSTPAVVDFAAVTAPLALHPN